MENLKTDIEKLGFCRAEEILTVHIPFEPSLIQLCEGNACGSFGMNYTCPPLVGETGELIEKAKRYEYAVVFQKVYDIEDSFDIEGMNYAKKDFKKLTKSVSEFCGENLTDFLILGAGPCDLCSICGAVDGSPCRFPKSATASLESYGILVSGLAKECGMKYINGQNTVTYFGAVLYG